MTSRRKGREATGKGLTSATLPATTVVTNIPAPVEVRGRARYGQTVFLFTPVVWLFLKARRPHLPNKAPTASPAVCGCENAAMALKMSGAPLPRARNVTPSAHAAVKENWLTTSLSLWKIDVCQSTWSDSWGQKRHESEQGQNFWEGCTSDAD